MISNLEFPKLYELAFNVHQDTFICTYIENNLKRWRSYEDVLV